MSHLKNKQKLFKYLWLVIYDNQILINWVLFGQTKAAKCTTCYADSQCVTLRD